MRGTHIDLMPRLGVNPTIGSAAASERERVSAVFVEHGKFELATERCGGDRLPLHQMSLQWRRMTYLDLNQIAPSRQRMKARAVHAALLRNSVSFS
jgi:hypothetical protein